MRDLRPSLPESMSEADKEAFAAVLNIGAGVIQRGQSVSLLPWPVVPW
jgi:hypothetical protein